VPDNRYQRIIENPIERKEAERRRKEQIGRRRQELIKTNPGLAYLAEENLKDK
jgi:hypothetical protein